MNCKGVDREGFCVVGSVFTVIGEYGRLHDLDKGQDW